MGTFSPALGRVQDGSPAGELLTEFQKDQIGESPFP